MLSLKKKNSQPNQYTYILTTDSRFTLCLFFVSITCFSIQFYKKCVVNTLFQMWSLESKRFYVLCAWEDFVYTATACLWKWETYFKCRTETSAAAVTCHCVVLFLYHVTRVVVCEQLIFLVIFLQDFLSITWTWQASLNLYFLYMNVYI